MTQPIGRPAIPTRSFAASALPRRSAWLLALAALACAPVTTGQVQTTPGDAPAPANRPVVRDDDPLSAREALARVHERWNGRWYHTAVVRLEVALQGLGAPAPGEWSQTMAVPGRARVDYLPLDSHSGVLYTPGAVYGFQEGALAVTEERTDLGMVALSDLPALAPDVALIALTAARVDTSLFRVADVEGAHLWIIGGGATDSLRSEIRIDADSLLVRYLRDVRRVGGRFVTTEARVESWQRRDGLTLPLVVNRWREGTHVLNERWAAIAIDVALPVGLFDPKNWNDVRPPVTPAVRPAGIR